MQQAKGGKEEDDAARRRSKISELEKEISRKEIFLQKYSAEVAKIKKSKPR